ncbi:hypothetical protein GWI33_020680 [Rhynchophorus ferrugineus]|uniref:TIL domain-containing protein n=1 Tax=Rhynchophorus ferrugineus TaxID=354439 RepID=A0A834HRM9_RHYFE|nr:hypothetical protein GWI33_020680 [Rhynchophorus ferrugineus]
MSGGYSENYKMKILFILSFFVISVVTDSVNDHFPLSAKSCGSNEVLQYGAPCMSTCFNRQFAYCGDKFEWRCYCKDGYIRKHEQGPCIRIEECRFV